MARPICGSRSAPSHPVCAAGSFSIHERMAWMTRMSARRVITVSPPGRSSLASAAMKRRVLSSQSMLPLLDARTWMTFGSTAINRCAAGWSKRTAPQIKLVGTPPPPYRRILYRSLTRSCGSSSDRPRGRAGLARQAMALAVRHERQIALRELAPSCSRDLEPALAGREHVEREASLHDRKLEPQGAVSSEVQ